MPRPKPTYKHTHAHTHQQRRRRANSGDTGQRNETERSDRTAHTLSVAHAITVREELMMRTVKRTHWRLAAACARVRRLSQCARRRHCSGSGWNTRAALVWPAVPLFAPMFTSIFSSFNYDSVPVRATHMGPLLLSACSLRRFMVGL